MDGSFRYSSLKTRIDRIYAELMKESEEWIKWVVNGTIGICVDLNLNGLEHHATGSKPKRQLQAI